MRRILELTMAVLFLSMVSCNKQASKVSDGKGKTDNAVFVDAEKNKPTKNLVSSDVFLRTIKGIHYVLPVTDQDIIDEVGLMLEGETGEAIELNDLKTCFGAFNTKDTVEIEVTEIASQNSLILKTSAEEYWLGRANDLESISNAVNGAIGAYYLCSVGSLECPGQCEVYAAMVSVSNGPRGLKHLTGSD